MCVPRTSARSLSRRKPSLGARARAATKAKVSSSAKSHTHETPRFSLPAPPRCVERASLCDELILPPEPPAECRGGVIGPSIIASCPATRSTACAAKREAYIRPPKRPPHACVCVSKGTCPHPQRERKPGGGEAPFHSGAGRKPRWGSRGERVDPSRLAVPAALPACSKQPAKAAARRTASSRPTRTTPHHCRRRRCRVAAVRPVATRFRSGQHSPEPWRRSR